MESTIQSGVQLLEQAKAALSNNSFYVPFQNEVPYVVALDKLFSKLDIFICEVASSYLGLTVHQEVSVNTLIDNPHKRDATYDQYRTGYLVMTKADTLEEKVLTFCNVCFVVDVVVVKLLMASQRWDQILDFCRQNKNRFVIFGTLVNDKYIHHQDIPVMDLFTLAPQFLTDTNDPPEIEVGEQLPKRKKNEPKKR